MPINFEQYAPFAVTDALIRDMNHVRVERLASPAGRHCKFKKEFKSAGLGDDVGYWMQREADFLLHFASNHFKHVAQMAAVARDGDDTQTPLIEYLVTWDAGITLEDWLKVQPRYANGVTGPHPFQHAGAFLQLLRACLIALREIHRARIVHCDIKPDNICLPYKPYPHQPGKPVSIDYGNVRLIDFAFSITQERPLDRPLPIEPIAPYQSNSLKTALREDQNEAKPCKLAIQKLDYRADLYSLGYLARQILDGGLLQPAGDAGHEALDIALRVVRRLEACNSVGWYRAKTLPHDGLILEIDGMLRKLTDLKTCNHFEITYALGTVSSSPLDKPIPPSVPTPIARARVKTSDQTVPASIQTPLQKLFLHSITPKISISPPQRKSKLKSLAFILPMVLMVVGIVVVYRIILNRLDDSPDKTETIKAVLAERGQAATFIQNLGHETHPTLRDCTDYAETEKDYSGCAFQSVVFYSWDNPEGANFKDATGLPAWVQKGLDENGVYRQNTLVEAIRKGFKDLQGANLRKADLHGLDLSGAKMKQANLQETNLGGADLHGVDWQNADLTGAIWGNGGKCLPGSIGSCVK